MMENILYFLYIQILSAGILLDLSKQEKNTYCRMNEICFRINALTLAAGVVELADAPDSKAPQ